MIRILKSFAAKVWAGILLLVIAAGLLVGTVRLVLPLAADYRAQWEQDLGRTLGMPVRVHRLGARLAGLSPELSLEGVDLLDPATGTVQLHFDEVRLRVGLWASLRNRMPVLELATLVGARLLLRRDREGELQLLGFGRADGAANRTRLSPAPLLSEGHLRLLDSEILWENQRLGLPPLRLNGVDASLVNAGLRHQLDVRARLEEAAGGTLEIHADFFGNPASPVDWYGTLYLHGRTLRLAPLLAPLLPDRGHLDGEADLELWTQWRHGLPVSASGSLAVDAPRLAGDGTRRPFLERLGSPLKWQRDEGGGWRLDLPALTLVRNGIRRPPTRVALRVRTDGDGATRVRVGAERLWLEDLAGLAGTLEAASDAHETLAGLAPRGELRGLDLALHLPPSGPPTWRAAGGIAQLALAPWRGSPGISGLDLVFRADQAHGEARLDSDDLELDFAGLFRWPIRVRRLAGELGWQHREGELVLSGDELRLDTDHLSTRSRLLLRLPADGASPFVDMQTDFHDGDGSATSRYLPSGILSPGLIQWLDRTIVSGHVTSGSFLLRGSVADFPYRERNGRFQVLFGVEQAILDYLPGWPRLEETQGEVLFQDEGLTVDLQEAGLLDSHVRSTRLHIPDLDRSPRAAIRGRVDGPFADLFRILRETPLAHERARYIHGMQALGDSEVHLDLDIPLDDRGTLRADGDMRWSGAGLVLQDWGLTLEQLEGRLAYSGGRLSGRGIRARLLGEPLRLDLTTLAGDAGQPDRTRIDLDWRIDPRQLERAWPHPAWEALSGSTPARVRLEIDQGDPDSPALPLGYRLTSPLRGLAVELPAPLGKPADQARPLAIGGHWPPAPELRVEAAYGDLKGAVRLAPDAAGQLRPVAGDLSVGEDRVPDPARTGFRLTGHLPRLDLDSWSRWLRKHPIGLPQPDPEERRTPSERAQLHIDELTLSPLTLRDLALTLTRTPHAWELGLDCDRLQGEVRLPDARPGAGVSIALQRLDLDPQALALSTQPSTPSDWPQPREVPLLFVRVDQLSVGGRPFGRLELKAAPMPGGVRLEKLALDGPLASLDGTGEWTGGGPRQSSHLALQLRSPDLGKTLRELAFTSTLDQADLDGRVDLRWPAPPFEASPDNLEGEVEFHLGAGRVLDVEPGVGRIFGLFNLGALNRRLTLDFSDLFAKGYTFDRIDGGFTLAHGVAQTRDLVLRGPAADIAVSGRTGLVTRDYDQLVTVTPRLSSTLPLAGGLVGGPVVGVTLLVLEKIMGDEVNKLIRFQYHVTGPWDDPEIERIQTQDGWSLSNLLQPGSEEEQEPNPFLE